ncbi:MAG: S-methyl-5'-thioinosine phosphorylase [Gammaproteobacteria bacterium]|nr:S-methyl-5'-thioinosine phosphorylase [Gammaproteobacteria bacterium]
MTIVAAVIGGTGVVVDDVLDSYAPLEPAATEFGAPSAALMAGRIDNVAILFLARHSAAQSIPPHRINYRANIAALKAAGAQAIFAFAAVGGITESAAPGAIVIPDQIIDYTHGRTTTFFDTPDAVEFIDFTEPYTARLRRCLLDAAANVNVPVVDGGVYGAVQGPRLETAAEIRRMRNDGCDIVGMTGMPEAALAREAGLPYATMAVVANRAAGLAPGELKVEDMVATLRGGQQRAASVLRRAILTFAAGETFG